MIESKQGNLLEEKTDALVNAVNCVGVMGKGIALQFKHAFPANFELYKSACDAGEVQPGKMFVVEISTALRPYYIINFPTKRHWRQKSKFDDIKVGMSALVGEVQRLKLESISIPALGCGYGGLDWAVVKPLIASTFEALPAVRVVLFEPGDIPEKTD